MLCLGGAPVQAQVAPLQYWIPGGPFGLGGSTGLAVADTDKGYDFRPGFFMSSGRGSIGLNGFGQAVSAGSFNALSYDSTKFGYSYKGAGGMPVTFFAGFDTLKYGGGIGSSLAPLTSSTAPGYSAFAGVEFKPTPNLSLSFGAGFTQQQSGRMDSDINSSMLPGESPALGALRR